MKKEKVKISSLKKVKKKFFVLEFRSSSLIKRAQPGQFLHLKIDKEGLLLRRPFSIHRIEKDKVFILFEVKGEGTKALAQYKRKDPLDIIGPLGRGFNYQGLTTSYQLPVIVAGGVGVAPLLFLAQRLSFSKRKILVFLGAKTKEEVLCKKDFERLGCRVFVATEDGSSGFKGKVTDLLKDKLKALGSGLWAKVFSCGPKEMFYELFKIIKNYPNIDCEISLEQFMGCGIGVCRACVIKTPRGFQRVCREGPVFNIREVF